QRPPAGPVMTVTLSSVAAHICGPQVSPAAYVSTCGCYTCPIPASCLSSFKGPPVAK
ncbi:hypothetical protein ABG768_016648, partial [Culter alburnus]